MGHRARIQCVKIHVGDSNYYKIVQSSKFVPRGKLWAVILKPFTMKANIP